PPALGVIKVLRPPVGVIRHGDVLVEARQSAEYVVFEVLGYAFVAACVGVDLRENSLALRPLHEPKQSLSVTSIRSTFEDEVPGFAPDHLVPGDFHWVTFGFERHDPSRE